MVDGVTPRFGTAAEMIEEVTSAHGGRDALVCADRRFTYQQLADQSATLADGLVGLGVAKGTRVGVLVPSGPTFVIAWLAVTRIGAVFVPISTFVKPSELIWQLRDADVHTVICRDRFLRHDYVAALSDAAFDESQLPMLRNVVVEPTTAPVPEWSTPLAALLDTALTSQRRVFLERTVRPGDDALVLYTSGTTATPKGVLHTHATMVRHPVGVNVRRGITCEDRLFLALPLFWVGGFSQGVVGAYLAGATLVVDETFDAGRALESIERERVTVVAGWPFHGEAMRAHPDYARRDLSALRLDVRNHLTPPDFGADVSHWPNWLGMTETFGAHLLAPLDAELPSTPGSFGTSLPDIEHRIVDPDTGRVLGSGSEGELQVRGYSLMRGYVGRERGDAFEPDGFFRTGDRGHFDSAGHFYLTGRYSDVIKASGTNVSAEEVAAALRRVAGVAGAHVTGVPDGSRGEFVVAAVVAAPLTTLDLDEILAAVRSELSAFKVPRRLLQLDADEIPMTATGKVNRAEFKRLMTARISELAAN